MLRGAGGNPACHASSDRVSIDYYIRIENKRNYGRIIDQRT
jgi:hypothetical protein